MRHRDDCLAVGADDKSDKGWTKGGGGKAGEQKTPETRQTRRRRHTQSVVHVNTGSLDALCEISARERERRFNPHLDLVVDLALSRPTAHEPSVDSLRVRHTHTHTCRTVTFVPLDPWCSPPSAFPPSCPPCRQSPQIRLPNKQLTLKTPTSAVFSHRLTNYN